MWPTFVRQAARAPLSPRIRETKRLYPPKKVWPPDFRTLSRGEQFRLEKKYKRRIALAMRRPRWNKAVRIAQLVTCSGVVIYGALFLDSHKGEEQPFLGFRRAFWSALGYDYISPSPAQKTGRPEA